MSRDEISKWQKTVHIINLMPDWSVWGMGEDGDDIVLQIGDKETAVLRAPDYLYAPKLMFLAWRVSNFVYSEFFNGEDWCDGYMTWWHEVDWYRYEPADAQRIWLDKILTLAIEAGMVTK